MNLNRISATSLSLYDYCPRQWALKYKYKLMEEIHDYFEIGKPYHTILERYHKGEDINVVLSEFRDKFLNDKKNDNIKLVAALVNLVEQYKRNPFEGNSLHFEYEFNVPLVRINRPDISLYGFMDRICEDDVIVDYKSSSKDFKDEDINYNQIGIYYYAYKEIFGREPKMFLHVNNKTKSKSKKYLPSIIKVDYNEDKLNKLMNDLVRFIDNVENERFEHKSGCYRCHGGKKY